MENTNQISFGLRQITTEQFAIINSALDESNANVELETGLRFGFKLEMKVISCLIAIKFTQNKNPFLLLEIGCHFEIKENDWDKLYNYESKEVKLSVGLARHLTMLCIGTLRGVLHAKTENTSFNKFLIPTFNVNNLVKEDIVIKTIESIEKK